MRNLKKVLSLVLALAMVLSLCMVGAGAVNYDDFTDEGTITKKQAVETLVSLNVILGYNGGNTFAPAENVKRSEMATMICRVLAGGDNMIVDATKPVATFADIDGHWAESYIEYCTSLGIVSGKSPTSFDPDANVTAAEAAKMVMTTLGYNADVENFKGIGWDINVMAKANTLKLLDNLQGEISASVPVTREQVAQMLFNALTADMVQNYVGTSANVWISSGAERYTQNLLEAKFNAEKITGVVVANEFASLYDTTPLSKGKTTLYLMDDNNDITKTAKTINLTTGQDDLGMSVIVYCDKTTSRVVFGDTQDTGLNAVQTFTNKMELAKGPDAPYTSADLKDAEYFRNYSEYLTNTAEVDHYFRIGFMKYTTNNGVITPNSLPSSKVPDKTLIYRIGDELDDTAYDELEQYIKTLIAKEDNPDYQYTEDDDVAKIGTDKYIPVLFEGRGEDNKEDYTTRVEYSSWKGFSRYYLTNITSGNMRSFDGNENGNYLKVVDANGDGAVDYVMKVEYTMAKVNSAKKGDLVLTKDVENITKEDDVKNPKTIKGSDLVTADEFAPGDVIVYFEADGVYYANLAETVTGVPTHVNYKTDVVTVDGTEYTESGITIGFNNPDDLFAYVDYMTREEETYNLYLDNYGYVRGWEIAMDRKGLVLLTRANTYKQNTSSASGFAVEAYDNEDGKIHGYDLNASRSDDKTYIRTSTSSFTNDWDKLIGVPMINGDTAANNWAASDYANKILFGSLDKDGNYVREPISLTNMAAANVNEDGVMTIQYVDEASNKEVVNTFSLAVQDMVNDSSIAARRLKTNEPLPFYSKMDSVNGNKTGDGQGNTVEQGVIYTNSDTVYYVVNTKTDARDNRTVVDRVRVYTGYGKLPSTIKAGDIDAMYAVATLTDYNSNSTSSTKEWYYTADAVVIETHSTIRGSSDVVFLYDTHTGALAKSTTADIIDKTGEDKEISLDKQNLGEWVDAMGFYRLYDGNTVAPILVGEYSANGIYAGTIHTHKRAEFTTRDGAGVVADTLQLSAETPVYTFSVMPANSGWDNVKSSVEKFGELTDKFLVGKDIIWYENKDGVQFIINVTDSFRSNEPAPRTALNAPALGMAFDDGIFAKNEAGYKKAHYDENGLYHVWSHVVNEPVYEQYKKLVKAWKDYTDSTPAGIETAKNTFKSVITQVQDELAKQGGNNNYTKASNISDLLRDVSDMIHCEATYIPDIFKGDDNVKTLSKLILNDAEQNECVNDIEEVLEGTVITGDVPVVTFYGEEIKQNANGTFVGEVSYGVAKAWREKNPDANAIVLEGANRTTGTGLDAYTLSKDADVEFKGTIQGSGNKFYEVIVTQRKQNTAVGELSVVDGTGNIVISDLGQTPAVFWIKNTDITLADLKARLKTDQLGDVITVTAKTAYGVELPDYTLLSALSEDGATGAFVTLTITNSDGYLGFNKAIKWSSEDGDKPGGNVTLTLEAGITAWSDADCTEPVTGDMNAETKVTTLTVAQNSRLWFKADGAGTFTATYGEGEDDKNDLSGIYYCNGNFSRSDSGDKTNNGGWTTSSIDASAFTISFTKRTAAAGTFTKAELPGSRRDEGAKLTREGNTVTVEYSKDYTFTDLETTMNHWFGMVKWDAANYPTLDVPNIWVNVSGCNNYWAFAKNAETVLTWNGLPGVITAATKEYDSDKYEYALELKAEGLNNNASETLTVYFEKVAPRTTYTAHFNAGGGFKWLQIALQKEDGSFLTTDDLETLGFTENANVKVTVTKTPVNGGETVTKTLTTFTLDNAGNKNFIQNQGGTDKANAGALWVNIENQSLFTAADLILYADGQFQEQTDGAFDNHNPWVSTAQLEIEVEVGGEKLTFTGLNGICHGAACTHGA